MPEGPAEVAPVFCRPQHKRPTAHLRLSGCGPGLGVPPDQLLEQLLRPLQCLHLAPWEGHQAHLFATFPDEPTATRALHALEGRVFLGRSISAKYAETREPRKVVGSVGPCGGPGVCLAPGAAAQGLAAARDSLPTPAAWRWAKPGWAHKVVTGEVPRFFFVLCSSHPPHPPPPRRRRGSWRWRRPACRLQTPAFPAWP